MSLKIKEVTNVRNLSLDLTDYSSKIGMIYGLNGTGKSTIKMIIESVYNKSTLKKNFSKQKENSIVKLEIDGKSYNYENEWDKIVKGSKIYIFDNNFINDNIFIDGKVSASQRPNISRVVYGKEVIKEYTSLNKISEKIYNKKIEYSKLLIAIKNSKSVIDILSLHRSIKTLEVIFSTEYSSHSISSTLVEEHIKQCLEDSPKSKVWLKDGLSHQKDSGKCPMCGQVLRDLEINLFAEIHDNELVAKTYNVQKVRLEGEKYHFDTIISGIDSGLRIGRKDFILNMMQNLKLTKEDNWNSKISVYGNATLKRLSTILFSTNDEINSLSDKLTSKNYDTNLTYANSLFSKGLTEFKQLKSKIIEIKKLEEALNRNTPLIRSKINDRFTNKIEAINYDLKLHGVPYQLDISNILDSSKSNAKKDGSQIEISLHLKHTDSKTDIKEKDISDTLSQGEKSILAWILFKNDIREEISTGSNLLLLDDPIASYDEFKRFPMIRSIREVAVNKQNKILILTHEKSFVSLYYKQKLGELYTIKSNKLSEVSIYDILNNELIENVISLDKINAIGISELNVIEFLIRSRKLIEFHNSLTNDRLAMLKRESNAFNNISRVLHCEAHVLSKETLKTIFRLLSKYQSGRITPKTIINMKKINLSKIAISNKNSLYSYRIILEEFLKSVIPKAKYKSFKADCKSKGVEPVVGRLYDFVKGLKKISDIRSMDISNSLPIVNTLYHNGDIHGLSVSDISDVNIKAVQKVVDELVSEL